MVKLNRTEIALCVDSYIQIVSHIDSNTELKRRGILLMRVHLYVD